MSDVMNQSCNHVLPELSSAPVEIINSVLSSDRRVLLVGAPGTGKSTLATSLADALNQIGRACCCVSADPGSPGFGIPGAVCLGRWRGKQWQLAAYEALCTLDAGRFRLPLMSAVRQLTADLPSGVVLVDGPGVVRGVAGAELLLGIVEAAAIDVVLMLVRENRPMPLEQELLALPAEVFRVRAAVEARRPGKRVRGRKRTQLWDSYLVDGEEQDFKLEKMPVLGTPPPLAVPSAWVGRQIAFLNGKQTLAMGEAMALEQGSLRVKVPRQVAEATSLLVRDAARLEDGCLGTTVPFVVDRLDYLPPPDIVSRKLAGLVSGGPRVVGRVGIVSVDLVNGVFGDPLLHLRLRHQRRSLLFDLGEGARLPARVAHQVSDVFITHAHIDHIAGFLWLLRSRIGDFPVCRIFGPPGLADNIDGLTRGILWDRAGEWGPRFEIAELHGGHLRRFLVQAGHPGAVSLAEEPAPDGLVLAESGFHVRATTLDHVSPVLAYAFEPSQQINIRKERLLERGLAPGPWLNELKRQLQAQEDDAPVQLPDGSVESSGALAADLALVSPGKKLVYATDFADTAENRQRLVTLARGAHTLFCESTFVEDDVERALRTAHLTTRACGEIADEAGIAQLVPFHFSRRYEECPEQIYEEIAAACSCVVVPKSMALFENKI